MEARGKAAVRNPGRLGGGAVAPSEEGGAMKTPKRLAPGSVRKRGRGGLIRNLFNEDKSDRISVIVRIRPPRPVDPEKPQEPSASCVEAQDDDKLEITAPAEVERNPEGTLRTYTFTKVLSEHTSQAEYYAASGGPMVEELVSVHSNYVMMAYGITGAGKTFTLEGPPSNPGVMPRALEHLFDLLDADPQRAHLKVCISYYEIYNEHIYDLLMPSDGMVNAGKLVELKVMEDAAGNVRVPGLTTKYVTSARHAMEHQIRGSALRTKAGTKLNASSSRSHAVFTVMLCEHQQHEQENQTESERNRGEDGEGLMTLSKLSFVDMAGAERVNRTGNSGVRFKESTKINGSLLALGRCLEALRANQMASGANQQIIPYRNSKITHIFRDVLHGQGRIMLAVSVSPDECDYSESLHMLEYARNAAEIRTVQVVATPVALHPGAPTPYKKRKTTDAPMLPSSTLFSSEETEGLRAEIGALKAELEGSKSALEGALKAGVASKLEVRRELVAKMQLTLEETEANWALRNQELVSEVERLTRRQTEMVSLHQEDEGAASAELAELREGVRREVEAEHEAGRVALEARLGAAEAQRARLQEEAASVRSEAEAATLEQAAAEVQEHGRRSTVLQRELLDVTKRAKRQLEEAGLRAATLQREVDEANSRATAAAAATVEEANLKAAAAAEDLQQMSAEAEAQMEELTTSALQEVEEAEAKAAELELQLGQAAVRREEAESELGRAKEAVSGLQGRVEGLSQAAAAKEEEVKEVAAKVAQLEDELEQAMETVAHLQGQVVEVTDLAAQELAQAVVKANQSEAALEQAMEKVAQLEGRVEEITSVTAQEVEQANIKAMEKVAHLKGRVEDITRAATQELEQANMKAMEKVAKLEGTVEEITSAAQELEQDNVKAMEKVAQLEGRVEEITSVAAREAEQANMKAMEKVAQLEGQVEEITSVAAREVKQTNTKAAALAAELEVCDKEVQEVKTKAAQLEGELEQAREMTVHLQVRSEEAAVKGAHELREAVEQVTAHMQDQVEEVAGKAAELEDELEQANRSLIMSQAETADAVNTREQAKRRIAKLQVQMEEMTDSSAETTNSAMAQQVEEANGRVAQLQGVLDLAQKSVAQLELETAEAAESFSNQLTELEQEFQEVVTAKNAETEGMQFEVENAKREAVDAQSATTVAEAQHSELELQQAEARVAWVADSEARVAEVTAALAHSEALTGQLKARLAEVTASMEAGIACAGEKREVDKAAAVAESLLAATTEWQAELGKERAEKAEAADTWRAERSQLEARVAAAAAQSHAERVQLASNTEQLAGQLEDMAVARAEEKVAMEAWKEQDLAKLTELEAQLEQAVESIDGAASTCMRQREHHHKEVRALTARCMREAAARERAAGEAATAGEARHAKEVEELRAETCLQAEALEEELQAVNKQQRELIERLHRAEREKERLDESMDAGARLRSSLHSEVAAVRASMAEEAGEQAEAVRRGSEAECARQLRRAQGEAETKLEDERREFAAAERRLKADVATARTNQEVLSLELESMDLTRRGLMAKVELALKERQHLMEQHQWELNLLRENLSLEVASTDSLSAEMEAMLQQKRDLVEKLRTTRRAKLALEERHVQELDGLTNAEESMLVERTRIRAEMSAELALEYEQKMDDAKDVYVQQDDVLAMQLSQLHRSKCQMQSELQAVTRERDHLSQCMQLLHSNDPALFQVEGNLHQSMDTTAWQSIIRQSEATISLPPSPMV